MRTPDLAPLVDRCTTATAIDELLGYAVTWLHHAAGADWAATAVLGPLRLIAREGTVPQELQRMLEGTALAGRRRELADGHAVVCLGESATDVTMELAILDNAVRRLVLAEELADLQSRVNAAQQLANMGDYDWHIASDTNTWSDQLYRIYGYEPGAFNACYDKFLGCLHPDDRERIQGVHQEAYATGAPYHMMERIVRPDGEVRFLSSNGEVIQDADGKPVRMRGTCVDVTEQILAQQAEERARAEGEALAGRLHDAAVMRRQALELNDNVVQGLTAAILSRQSGDEESSTRYMRQTLVAAQGLMNDWILPYDGEDVGPGSLVRAEASHLVPEEVESVPTPRETRRLNVLVVEDNDDVRRLLRAKLEVNDGYDVSEAEDGIVAVEAASALQPDVVLLDLAMPRMDGLTALPLILEESPHTKVIVVSGFDQKVMAQRALEAGAHGYLEKGFLMDLDAAIRDVLALPLPA
jgi:PAS domain S-box-containing protein